MKGKDDKNQVDNQRCIQKGKKEVIRSNRQSFMSKKEKKKVGPSCHCPSFSPAWSYSHKMAVLSLFPQKEASPSTRYAFVPWSGSSKMQPVGVPHQHLFPMTHVIVQRQTGSRKYGFV